MAKNEEERIKEYATVEEESPPGFVGEIEQDSGVGKDTVLEADKLEAQETDTEEEEEYQVPAPVTPSIAQRVGETAGRAAGGTLSYIGEKLEGEDADTREANGDDLSDMFVTPHKDDPDMRVDDLLRVTEEDVFGDGGEDMSDMIEVSEEDIMGEGDEDMEDLLDVPEEEEDLSDLVDVPDEETDLSDLVDVSREDVLGHPPGAPADYGEKERPHYKLRTKRRYVTPRSTPSPSVGGVRE